MIPSWVTLVSGPILALIPILGWEVVIKPQRLRRNAALVLQSEIDLCLAWLLRLAEARSANAKTLPAAVRLPRDAYAANVTTLGELPTGILTRTMFLYSRLDAITAIVEKLQERYDELATRPDERRQEWLRDSLRRGQGSLDSSLRPTIESALALRHELYDCAAATMFGDIEPIIPDSVLRSDARDSERARVAAHSAEITTGAS